MFQPLTYSLIYNSGAIDTPVLAGEEVFKWMVLTMSHVVVVASLTMNRPVFVWVLGREPLVNIQIHAYFVGFSL